MDLSGAVKGGELVIQQAREQHETIGRNVEILRGGGVILRPGFERRLQHGVSIIKNTRPSNPKLPLLAAR